MLIDWLVAKFPKSSRSTLKKLLEDGRVTVNGRPVKVMKTPIGEKDVVEVLNRAAGGPPKPSLEPLTLVYEDAELLVVDKPPGLLTSTVPREKRPTAIAIVIRYLAGDRKARPGLVHRLDRDASGLLVFAKTLAAFDSFKSQFFHHTAGRVYEALVHGKPREAKGTIDSFLIESKEGKVFVTKDENKGQHAITHYEVIGEVDGFTHVRVQLQTGRKHQIRTHLASRGHPIVGDVLYGPQPPKRERLMLRGVELSLDHPRTGKRLELKVQGWNPSTSASLPAGTVNPGSSTV